MGIMWIHWYLGSFKDSICNVLVVVDILVISFDILVLH